MSGHAPSPSPRYRPEIDGMRAVAVMMVVFHHADFAWASGGFIGVDIFFVLSGHVITVLALDAMETGRFSIVDFYERRARRIMPALIVMCASLLAPAYWLMLPGQLIAFGRNLVATLLLYSNVSYWRAANYFSERAELNPLLHSWTLAVEGQFYLLFPLVIPMLRRLGLRPMILILATALLASLALSQWAAHSHPSANFYLAPSRAWELIAGILSAIAHRHGRRIARPAASWIALPLLILPMLIYDAGTPFPGFATVPVVLGTILLLQGEVRETAVGRLLAMRPLVLTGLMSYSLYLWHQPLFAFYRLYRGGEISTAAGWILIVLVFPIAYLSWRFVEGPARRPDGPLAARTALLLFLAGSIGSSVVVAHWIKVERGLPQRIPASVIRVLDARFGGRNGCLNRLSAEAIAAGERCFIGAEQGRPTLAIIGDSHATSIADDLSDALRDRGIRAKIFTWSWCPPLARLDGDLPARRKCIAARDEALEQIAADSHIRTVLFYAEWANYTTGYTQASYDPPTAFHFDGGGRVSDNPAQFARAARATFTALERSGKRVIVIRSTPEFTFRVPERAARLLLNRSAKLATLDLPLVAYHQRSGDAMRRLDQAAKGIDVRFVDPIPTLCTAGRCPVVNGQGEALYTDHNHLSRRGAQRIVPLLVPLIEAPTR